EFAQAQYGHKIAPGACWVRPLRGQKEAVEQVGVEVDESAVASTSPAAVPLEDSGFAEFVATGTPVSGDFRCPESGYGAVVQRSLPQCPMCGGTVWELLGQLASRLAD